MRELLHTASLAGAGQKKDSLLLNTTLGRGTIWYSVGDAVAGFVFRTK